MKNRIAYVVISVLFAGILTAVWAEPTYLKCENYVIPEPVVETVYIEGNETINPVVETVYVDRNVTIYIDKNVTSMTPLIEIPPIANSELFTGKIVWGENEGYVKGSSFIGKVKLNFTDGTIIEGYTNNTGNYSFRIPIKKRFKMSAYNGKEWIEYARTIVIDDAHDIKTSLDGKAPWSIMDKNIEINPTSLSSYVTSAIAYASNEIPCIPFGAKHFTSSQEKVNGHWVTVMSDSVYWKKCRRSPTDWAT